MSSRSLEVDDVSSPAKRARLGLSVSEHLTKVRNAVSAAPKRNDHCATMLDQMALGSLIDGIDERDEIQAEATVLVERVIEEIKSDLEHNARKAKRCLEHPNEAKQDMENELAAAEKHQNDVERDLEVKKGDLEKAKEAKAAADTVASDAALKRAESQRHLEKIDKEKQAFTDAFKDHFIPVRDGSWQTRNEVETHLARLAALFKRFNYEDSLTAAFKPAGLAKPKERRDFCHKTIKEGEKGFGHHTEDLLRQAQAQVPICEEAEQEHKKAEDDLKEKVKEERAHANAVGVGKRDFEHAKRAADNARQALNNFPSTSEAANEAATRADHALQYFMEGAYASFQYLRDRIAELEKHS